MMVVAKVTHVGRLLSGIKPTVFDNEQGNRRNDYKNKCSYKFHNVTFRDDIA